MHKAIDPRHVWGHQVQNGKIKFLIQNGVKIIFLKMQESSIYVVPREYEGIGMIFWEAMAMGCCVISPDNPTMNEYIKNGKTGILYDLSNSEKVDLSNVREIQKNVLKYIETDYKNWIKKRNGI